MTPRAPIDWQGGFGFLFFMALGAVTSIAIVYEIVRAVR